MEYLVALRVGQNDVKALINLEDYRKEKITPLLMMKGKNKHLDTFLSEWGDYNFYIDVSRFPNDEDDEFITSVDPENPTNGYQNKRDFFDSVYHKNSRAIPVLAWHENAPLRDIVQCGIKLDSNYERMAIRVKTPISSTNQNILNSFLAAISDISKLDIIFDFEHITLSDQDQAIIALPEINKILETYKDLSGFTLSTSFPIEKPQTGTSRTITCYDPVFQSSILKKHKNLSYGDYGATTPSAPMEFEPWMQIIPFVNYCSGFEWWQKRDGGNKEYYRYVTLANDIKSLAFYHGSNFCWGNEEVERISQLDPNPPAGVKQKHGGNGEWNGIRINQHICAMLDDITSFSASGYRATEDGEDTSEEA